MDKVVECELHYRWLTLLAKLSALPLDLRAFKTFLVIPISLNAVLVALLLEIKPAVCVA